MTKRKPIRERRAQAHQGDWRKAVLKIGSMIGGALLVLFVLADLIVTLPKVSQLFTREIPAAWQQLQENPEYIPPTLIVFSALLLVGGALVGVVWFTKRLRVKRELTMRGIRA